MALTMIILTVACGPSRPVIAVEPSASSLQLHETARASVIVQDIADLTAFEVHLSFDAKALEVIELDDGGFIKPDFVVQKTFDNVGGTIDYAVAQLNRPPANGSGTLLEIVFRAKAQGKSLLRFRETLAAPMGALFSDSHGIAIPVSLINGSVNVDEARKTFPAVASSSIG